ncbi:MAG: hypothetical protein PHX08_08105 [Lachnospiraceae bacterium]|nr:hypothetical protein [Lachnospiraceae bacterium]
MDIKELRNAIENEKVRSAWGRGKKEYALELIEEIETVQEVSKERLLNGADNWNQFSYGGCSLIYDFDIAERLCNPSELKKCKGGENRPNKSEEWLDVQARALNQACAMVLRLKKGLVK